MKYHWTEEMIATAAGMKRAGISTAKIAERLGLPPREVTKQLVKSKARAKLTIRGARFNNTPQRLAAENRQVEGTEEWFNDQA